MNAVVSPSRRHTDDLRQAYGEAAPRSPLRVAVLLDGSARCDSRGAFGRWRRLAEAATGVASVDLTLHLLGDPGTASTLAQNVRTRSHRASLSSWCLPFVHGMPEHLDVGWVHPALLADLSGCDVIHTSDGDLAAARTAALARALWRMALVTSLHTPVRNDAEVDATGASSWWSRRGRMARVRGPRLADRVHHKRRAHARRCDWVLTKHDRTALAPVVGHERCSLLRNGLDRVQFHPRARDRVRLRRQLGIPVTAPVLCFAGPLGADTRPELIACAVRELADAGRPVHAIFAGEGEAYAALAGEVRELGHFPGNVSQDTLAWLLASSDLFVSPAPDEGVANVLLEAMGCGLPLLVAPGGAQRCIRPGVDGLVVHASTPAAWAQAIAGLLDDTCARLTMGRAARAAVERHVPTWREVLEEDLLPAWRAAARHALARHIAV